MADHTLFAATWTASRCRHGWAQMDQWAIDWVSLLARGLSTTYRIVPPEPGGCLAACWGGP
jgi:hypothetical protein